MAKARIEKVFLLETEQPEDSFFSPSGVVVVWEKQRITLHCQNSVHNLYRSAIIRHGWADLERGVVFRHIGFRLRDYTVHASEQGWIDSDGLSDIIHYMKDQYPRHLYFLENRDIVES